jgi:hypothetical protein
VRNAEIDPGAAGLALRSREDVVAVILEVGVVRHFLAQLHHPVEQRGEFVMAGDVRQIRGIDEQYGEVQPGVRRGDSRLRAL